MRFNIDDYLKAFPREDRTPATPTVQSTQETPAGDVFDQEKEPDDKQEPDAGIAPEPEGGAEDGNE